MSDASPQSRPVVSAPDDPLDWGAIASRVLHPTKLHIIEAMRWIDRPLSATELERIFEGSRKMSILSHHLTSMAKLGILTLAEKRKVRGAWQRLYVPARAVRSRPSTS